MKRKSIRLQYNAPVTLTFALIALLAMGLDQLTNGWTTNHLFCVYRSSLLDPLFYVRLFGHVLGHASWSHYISNMTLLLVLGPILEEKYGSKNILYAFLVTAFVTGAAHLLLNPSQALLGASGIVFACVMLASLAGMSEGSIPLTLIFVAIIYIGGEVYDAVTTQDSISQMTHIIGGIVGTIAGYVFSMKGHKKKKR